MEDQYIASFSNKSFLLKNVDKNQNCKLFRDNGGRWYNKLKNLPSGGWLFPLENKQKILGLVKKENIVSSKEKEIEDIVKTSKDNTKQKKYHRAVSATNSVESESESDEIEVEEPEKKQSTIKSSRKEMKNETQDEKTRGVANYEDQYDKKRKMEKIEQFKKEKERFDKTFHKSGVEKVEKVEKKKVKLRSPEPKSVLKNKTNRSFMNRSSANRIPVNRKTNDKSQDELQRFYKAFSKNPKKFKKLYRKSRSESQSEEESSQSESVDESSESSQSESDEENFKSDSESENSSSSDDYPAPESPYKKKLKRLNNNEPIFSKLKEIEKKIYKMEMEKKRKKV